MIKINLNENLFYNILTFTNLFHIICLFDKALSIFLMIAYWHIMIVGGDGYLVAAV